MEYNAEKAIEIEIPTKSVLHFDKKWNLTEREDEINKIPLTESVGRLFLKMLGTTPEDVVEHCMDKRQ